MYSMKLCSPDIAKHAQVPEDQLPTYAKGQHLRGIDATIVERVSAEMVSTSQHRLTSAFILETLCCLLAASPVALRHSDERWQPVTRSTITCILGKLVKQMLLMHCDVGMHVHECADGGARGRNGAAGLRSQVAAEGVQDPDPQPRHQDVQRVRSGAFSAARGDAAA